MNITNFFSSQTTNGLTFSRTPPVDAAADKKVSNISKIESLSQIKEVSEQPDRTIFFFDLDDTIFDFPYMLGSKAWRRYFAEATKKINSDKNWHDLLSYFLVHNYPVKAIEPNTSDFIKDLQKKGFVVCGLTARERKIWYDTKKEGVDQITNKQLSSVNVDFYNYSLENAFPYLTFESDYYNGTFFAHLEPKGNYLLHLFEGAPDYPEKVIFIDDKLSQVESVASALNELGIENECYFYYATDAKARNFNPLIANIQLYYFLESDRQKVLSDEQAAQVAKADVTKDADWYLREILEMAKYF